VHVFELLPRGDRTVDFAGDPDRGSPVGFNNRENSFLFRDTLLRLLASTNLEYKNLIAEDDAA